MADKRSKGRLVLGAEDDDEEEVKIPPQTIMISTGGDGQIANQRRPLDRQRSVMFKDEPEEIQR